MSRLSFTAGFVALAAIAVVSYAPLACAGDTVAEVHAHIAKVDFSDPEQVTKLYKNIKDDARYVCDVEATYDRDDATDNAKERDCEASAMSEAVRSIHQPALSALDDRQNGRDSDQLALNAPKR